MGASETFRDICIYSCKFLFKYNQQHTNHQANLQDSQIAGRRDICELLE